MYLYSALVMDQGWARPTARNSALLSLKLSELPPPSVTPSSSAASHTHTKRRNSVGSARSSHSHRDAGGGGGGGGSGGGANSGGAGAAQSSEQRFLCKHRSVPLSRADSEAILRQLNANASSSSDDK